MHRLAYSVQVLMLGLAFLTACSTPAPNSPAVSPVAVPSATRATRAAMSSHTTMPTLVPSTPTPMPITTAPTPKLTGLRVVYSRDGYIMLWAEGQGTQQLPEASPDRLRISDDGRMIAYLARDQSGADCLYAVGVNDARPRLLMGQEYLSKLQPAATTIGDFAFVPASHTLYVVTDRYDLHRMSAEVGLPSAVLPAAQGGFFSFSPDGVWITLYHPNELTLIRSDGTHQRAVLAYPEDYQFTMMGPEVVWEPDSSGFYTVAASGPQGTLENMTVWFISAAGDATRLMSYTGPYGSHLAPNGRLVGYAAYQNEPIDVHIVGADGKDSTYGAFASQAYPAFKFMGWAPDSGRFVLDLSADGRLSVPHLCALGEQPVRLADTDEAYPIAWVDPQRILFISAGGSGQELRLQRLGAQSRVLDKVDSGEFAFVDLKP